jgi:dTDP-4-dehydrorhamnose 3,5-epimerase-like enzyme
MTAIRLIQFPKFENSNGKLAVYENGVNVPFPIKRVFTISGKENDVRGEHAHKKCTQLLICIHGEIRIDCDDGSNITHYVLNNMSVGLLIPPGVWAKEEYQAENSILMVLCDRCYEEEDYIRDYNEFSNWAST